MDINIGQQTECAGYKPQIAIGLDKTLTKQGYAAEAKAVGLALQQNHLHTYSEELVSGGYNTEINAQNIGINASTDLDVYAGEISFGSENNAQIVLDSGTPKTDIFGWNLNIGSEEGIHTTSPSVDFSADVDGSVYGFGGISFSGYEQEEDGDIITSTTVNSTANTTTLNFHHRYDTPAARLAVNVDGSLNVGSNSYVSINGGMSNITLGSESSNLHSAGRFSLMSLDQCFLTMDEEDGTYVTSFDTPVFRVQAYEDISLSSTNNLELYSSDSIKLMGFGVYLGVPSTGFVYLPNDYDGYVQFPPCPFTTGKTYVLKYRSGDSSEESLMYWEEVQ